MKALILCNDFPPINSIGAERPYGWFLHFKENGIEPIVITKNWISNGNSKHNKISNETLIEKTNNGLLIKTALRLTPSLLWRKYFKNRLSKIGKALTLFDKILSFISIHDIFLYTSCSQYNLDLFLSNELINYSFNYCDCSIFFDISVDKTKNHQ